MTNRKEESYISFLLCCRHPSVTPKHIHIPHRIAPLPCTRSEIPMGALIYRELPMDLIIFPIGLQLVATQDA